MASVFVLLEAFTRKEAAALGFFPCATAPSLLGITFFPQNPWIPVHPLSQGMHPRRHFPPSYNRRPRYLRPYGRLRLLFLPCRRFSANHLPPEICLRTCPQCPDIRLRVTLPGNWKSSCLRWKIFKIELNEPFWNLLKVFLPYVLTEFICILTTIWPLLCSRPSKCRKRGCCTRKESKCSSLFTVKCLQKHKNDRHRPHNFQKADNSNRPFWITIVFQRSLFSKFSKIRNSGML